jgi:hypothetical protein
MAYKSRKQSELIHSYAKKDEYLIQKAVQLQMDTKEIRYINYCRLYLNMVTISDITEPDGICMSGNISPG